MKRKRSMEWSTVCTAHNPKTIWNKREDKADLLRKIDGLRKKNCKFPHSKPIYGGFLLSHFHSGQ